MKLKRINAIVAVCAIAMYASTLQSGPANAGGTLIFAQAGEPDSLDPPVHSNDFSAEVIRMVFENLVRFAEHAESLEIEPALATRWEQAEDGLSWSFELREGVTFHDGTPFNSDAVVHFFDDRVFGGDRPPKAWPLFGDLVTSVEADGPYNVTINLARPHAYFLQRLAHQGAAIGSPEAYRQHGGEIAFQPVGTGPFRFVEAERGAHITLEANPDYWRGAPKLEGVVIRPVREAGTRALQIEAGQVHVTSALPDEIVPRLEANPNVEVVPRLSNMAIRMDLNTARPPLDDIRVRQALNLAVDKDAIADFLFDGTAVVIPGAVSPVTEGYFDFRGWGY